MITEQKKTLAVVGYGGQGGWHCAQAEKSDVVRLAGIYDIDPTKRQLAESRGIPAYASLEALLADEKVEIVTVATPNDSHKDITVQALKAGKHVICEKPVELTAAAFDEMEKAAQESGKLFTVHQNRRFDVDYLGIRQILREGSLGEPWRLESRIHGSRGIPSDWRGLKQFGGGMLYDWGVHLIDQMLLLFEGKKIARVRCDLVHTTNFEVDDGFRMTLFFEGGVTGYIEVGTLNFIAMPRFYLLCQSGSAMITDWRENARLVRCTHWNEKEVLPVQTAAGITKTMAPRDSLTVAESELPRPVSDVHDFYRNFTAAMDGKEELLVRPAQVRRVLRVIEAGFASAKTGAPVPFDEV